MLVSLNPKPSSLNPSGLCQVTGVPKDNIVFVRTVDGSVAQGLGFRVFRVWGLWVFRV